MSAHPEHVEHLQNLAKAKAFLGREFLTWLWHLAETTDGGLTAPGRGSEELEFDVWVDDRIVLEASAGLAHENVIKGGDPSQSQEASAALATGKTVREMKVGINVRGYGEYTAVLNCDELNPRSLKLPKPDTGEGAAASPDELPIVARLKYTDVFLAVLDGLFARFLAARTETSWQDTGLKSIRDWIKQRHTEVANLH